MNFSRRHFVRIGGGAAAAAATVGCDQAPEGMLSFLPPGEEDDPGGPFQAPAAESIDLVSHVLNRFSFGPRPGDHQRVSEMGDDPEAAVRTWLEQQLKPADLDDAAADYAVRRFQTLNQPLGELFEYKEKVLLEEMTRATLLRAALSKRQLYEVMVQFWSDHFNIDPSKGDCKWLKVADDRDVIRRHALGSFPEMLRASALSPAMLWYLDGRVNRKQKPDDEPNENYARELMELHTLGVHGGYSQQDVMEVARCLTGWTVRSSESSFQIGKVEFKQHLHDDGPKEVLGESIPAGLGREDLDRVLGIIALHPSTANYIALKLCRRFIADEPSENAVAAVAEAFLNSGGDIGETLRAVFHDDEFRAARGNKIKRPFKFVASALRISGAKSDAARPLIEFLVRMGHAPFGYPTPDGYPEEAQPWMGTLLWRWHFGVALSGNKINGTRVDFAALKKNLGGGDVGLMAHFLGRQPSELEIDAYQKSSDGLALLLASPAFQRC